MTAGIVEYRDEKEFLNYRATIQSKIPLPGIYSREMLLFIIARVKANHISNKWQRDKI